MEAAGHVGDRNEGHQSLVIAHPVERVALAHIAVDRGQCFSPSILPFAIANGSMDADRKYSKIRNYAARYRENRYDVFAEEDPLFHRDRRSGPGLACRYRTRRFAIGDYGSSAAA